MLLHVSGPILGSALVVFIVLGSPLPMYMDWQAPLSE
jgi:hypothetical protein